MVFAVYCNQQSKAGGSYKMKIAVITGASSGIGLEFAKALAEDPKFDEMWLIARSENKLRSLGDSLSIPCKIIPLDLTKAEALEEYKNRLESVTPEITVMVNASGFGKFGHHTAVKVDESLNMIDLNCKAILAMTEYSLPYLSDGAEVYEMGSLSSFQPVPYLNTYAATKAFVLSYTRGLRRELRSRRIKLMAVCPGWVGTDFFDRAATADTDAVTYYNKIYTPEAVVRTALKDMKRGRDVSIHGLPVKLQVLGVKLLPHSLVMKIWLKQQGHDKD